MKWEYLVRTRHRDQGMINAGKWKDDVAGDLGKLGNDRWELVSIVPEVSVAGHALTTHEVWVFKRPKT